MQSKERKKVLEVSAEIDQIKKFSSAVRSISKQVSSLQSELNDETQRSFRNRDAYTCNACMDNDVDKCDHCCKCEGKGHQGHQGRYGKKAKGRQQGNQKVLLEGRATTTNKECTNIQELQLNIDNHNCIYS